MGPFSWLFTGLLVGLVARLLVPGPHGLGCIGTSVLGILGSLVGGTLGNAVSGNGFDLEASGFVGAVLGAVLLLVLARLFGRGGGTSRPPSFDDRLDRHR